MADPPVAMVGALAGITLLTLLNVASGSLVPVYTMADSLFTEVSCMLKQTENFTTSAEVWLSPGHSMPQTVLPSLFIGTGTGQKAATDLLTPEQIAQVRPLFGVARTQLMYRADLLLKYNFTRPPSTLHELHVQGVTIAQGEAAAGTKMSPIVMTGAQFPEAMSKLETADVQSVFRGLTYLARHETTPLTGLMMDSSSVYSRVCHRGDAVFAIGFPVPSVVGCNFPILGVPFTDLQWKTPFNLRVTTPPSDYSDDYTASLRSVYLRLLTAGSCAPRLSCEGGDADAIISTALVSWGRSSVNNTTPADEASVREELAASNAAYCTMSNPFNLTESPEFFSQGAGDSPACRDALSSQWVELGPLLLAEEFEQAESLLLELPEECQPRAGTMASDTDSPEVESVLVVLCAALSVGLIMAVCAGCLYVRHFKRTRVGSDKQVHEALLEGPVQRLMQILQGLDKSSMLQAGDRDVVQGFLQLVGKGKDLYAPDLKAIAKADGHTDEVTKWILATLADATPSSESSNSIKVPPKLATMGTGSFQQSKFRLLGADDGADSLALQATASSEDVSTLGPPQSRRGSNPAALLGRIKHCVLAGSDEDLSAGTGTALICAPLVNRVRSPTLTSLLPTSNLEEKIAEYGGVDVVEVGIQVGADEFVLPLVFCLAVNHLGLMEVLSMDAARVQGFADAVCSQYRSELPYHNSLHAADVVHSMLSQLMVPQLEALSPLHHIASLIAAAAHDVGHTGQNNNWHITTQSDLAVWYSDKSCLEHYHLACAFTIMRAPSCDLLHTLSKSDRTFVRGLVVDMVLATDLAHSFDITNRFKLQMDTHSNSSWVSTKEGSSLALQMALKACDIGHAAKPLEQHIEWSRRVTHEFFAQGELERDMGLPISPLCDHETCNLPKSQIGFLQFVAAPCFSPWTTFTGQRNLIDNLEANRDYWRREAGEVADAPLPAPRTHSIVAARRASASSVPEGGFSDLANTLPGRVVGSSVVPLVATPKST